MVETVEIYPPWNGRDTTPAHGQLIIAAIGELGSDVQSNYVMANYMTDPSGNYLSIPLLASGRSPEIIPTKYLRSWKSLTIQGPGK